MTYLKMLEYLYKERPSGKITLGLDRIQKLCERLGNPQNVFKSAHIAGTNGKGSVTRFLSWLFIEHGLKTAAYYSPHLTSFKERILVDEKFITDETMLNAFHEVQQAAIELDKEGEQSKPSFFEFTTAMAFCVYRDMKTQAASIEVGLGGRFDATNVLTPEVSVIVTVGFDHMHILGNTLEKIAFEKAGIIKENIPVVCGETNEIPLNVINQVAHLKNCSVYLLGKDFYYDNEKLFLSNNTFDFHSDIIELKDLKISLNGAHQFLNASVALQAFLIFAQRNNIKIDELRIRSALSKTTMPGRFEVVGEKPKVIFDGAHNLSAALVLRKSIKDYLEDEKIAAVIGIVDDKDKKSILTQIAPMFDRIVVTRPFSHRAQNTQETFQITREINANTILESDPIKAYEILKSDGYETIIVTGSLYLVGYLRDYIMDGQLDPEWIIAR